MAVRTDRDRCERWFVRRGLPHLIHRYSVTADVLTRAAPFLGLVLFVEFFLVFGDRWDGWAQAGIFMAGIGISAAAVAGVNRARGRRTWQLPKRVGPIEIGAYFGLGAAFTALGSETKWVITNIITIGVINLLLLAGAYLVTNWGLIPMVRWSTVQVWRQVGHVSILFVKSMPILLLFSVFVFLNAEMWQVANDFTLAYYGVTAAGLVLIGASFVMLSVRRLAVDLARFTSWSAIRSHCAGTPVADIVPGDGDSPPDHPGLSRRERLNVSLLLFVAQSIQITLVAAINTAFYLVFGLFTVREETMLQWTTASEFTSTGDWVVRYSLWGEQLLFSRQLLLVAGFMGLLSGLQFTVSVVTDAGYRAEFAEDMTEELRSALAVRAVYHHQFVN